MSLNQLGRMVTYFGYFIGFTIIIFSVMPFNLEMIVIGLTLMLASFIFNRGLQFKLQNNQGLTNGSES